MRYMYVVTLARPLAFLLFHMYERFVLEHDVTSSSAIAPPVMIKL